MSHLAIDCPGLTPEVYRRCLNAAESILVAAGFTAHDVANAQRLTGQGEVDLSGRIHGLAPSEALAAFNLAEFAAQSESKRGSACRLVLVQQPH